MGEQKSAEGIVAPSTGVKARTCRNEEDRTSMNEADADSMAEMSEPRLKAAVGNREDRKRVRQAFTAGKEESSSKTTELMEQVVERENLREALKRVVANKGAPGSDGVNVEARAARRKRPPHATPTMGTPASAVRPAPEPGRGPDPSTGDRKRAS